MQDEIANYRCDCNVDWTGRDCEISIPFAIDECDPDPCQNGASCTVSAYLSPFPTHIHTHAHTTHTHTHTHTIHNIQ